MCVFTADVKDDQGQSPLDTALDNDYNEGCVEVAQYLMHLGYGGDKERVRLLHEASHHGKLDVVQELVEQHKVDPSECVLMIASPLQLLTQRIWLL